MLVRVVFGLMVALIGLAGSAPARAERTADTPTDAATCMQAGGVVQLRRPTYGTNGSNPLPLERAHAFCRFTSAKDGASISLLLGTLVTQHPTLAALAYYAKVRFDGSNCHGSPGSCYCSQVGGTDLFGGINAAGGGWVLTSDKTDTLDACIFPDLSSIDAYGLFYHSHGIVRGINLAKVLAYPDPY